MEFWLVVLGAVIGAAGSILGGWLAARYQLVGTARVMRAIRREERQEAALLEVVRLLTPISEAVGRMQASYRVDPDGTRPESFRQAVGDAVDALVDRWNEDLSAQALGAGIETDVLKILVEYMRVPPPWEKDNPSIWLSAAEIQDRMRAIEGRIREILGTPRPKAPGDPRSEA